MITPHFKLTTLLLAVLAACTLLSRAQETPAPAPASNDASAAPGAEVPLMRQISNGFDILSSNHESHKADLNYLNEQVMYLSKIKDRNDRLRGMLFLETELQKINSSIQMSEDRHIELVAKINTHRQSFNLLKQDETYLNFYVEKMQAMLREREIIRQKLGKIRNMLRQELVSMPPPTFFIGESGIRFVLIKGKKRQFYISERPISVLQYASVFSYATTGAPPVFDGSSEELKADSEKNATNMNFSDSQHFADALSKWEGGKFTLPTEEDIKTLKAVNFVQPDIAIWLFSVYGASLKEQRLMKTFAVSMASVWDPKGALRTLDSADSDIFGELPQAHYSNLGIYVTTTPAVAKQLFFNRVRRDIHINGLHVAPPAEPSAQSPAPETDATAPKEELL